MTFMLQYNNTNIYIVVYTFNSYKCATNQHLHLLYFYLYSFYILLYCNNSIQNVYVVQYKTNKIYKRKFLTLSFLLSMVCCVVKKHKIL